MELFKDLEENIPPRIILLDYDLPYVFNGDKIIIKLKDNKRYEHIPVFSISAMSKDSILAKLKEKKPDGIIEKPFAIKDLTIILKKLNRLKKKSQFP